MHEARSMHEYVNTDWLSEQEGQLSVDVVETHTQVIVRSAIAGVRSEDLDITLSEDTLTIRGHRYVEQEHTADQLIVQECHWGNFSRSIILPSHVDPDSVHATLKRGILTITMKKKDTDKKISVHELP